MPLSGKPIDMKQENRKHKFNVAKENRRGAMKMKSPRIADAHSTWAKRRKLASEIPYLKTTNINELTANEKMDTSISIESSNSNDDKNIATQSVPAADLCVICKKKNSTGARIKCHGTCGHSYHIHCLAKRSGNIISNAQYKSTLVTCLNKIPNLHWYCDNCHSFTVNDTGTSITECIKTVNDLKNLIMPILMKITSTGIKQSHPKKSKRDKLTTTKSHQTARRKPRSNRQKNESKILSTVTAKPSSSKNFDKPGCSGDISTDDTNVEFTVGDVIWGKIRGFPHWPGKIEAIENGRFIVYWFNDYRRTKLSRNQMFTFYPHYDDFANKSGAKIELETAAKEALLYLTSGCD